MGKKTWITLVAGFVVVAGISTGVTMLGLHMGMGSSQSDGSITFHNAHTALHQIDLTKAQQKNLEAHEIDLKNQLDKIQLELAEKRISVCQVLNSSSLEANKIMASVDDIGALQTQQQKMVVRHLLAMRDILTPRQRDQFYGAIMSDICVQCRHQLGSAAEKCLCGRCALHSDHGKNNKT